MPNRTSLQPNEEDHGQRAPISQRLWRNQLGILLAVALTLAAASVLMSSFRG